MPVSGNGNPVSFTDRSLLFPQVYWRNIINDMGSRLVHRRDSTRQSTAVVLREGLWTLPGGLRRFPRCIYLRNRLAAPRGLLRSPRGFLGFTEGLPLLGEPDSLVNLSFRDSGNINLVNLHSTDSFVKFLGACLRGDMTTTEAPVDTYGSNEETFGCNT